MLCEICKTEEATVHLTKVAEGQVKKMHLCEACKEEMGIDTESPSSITDLFPGGNDEDGVSVAPTEVVPALVCPTCDMTKLNFKKSGRLGCATCYTTFEEDLLPLVQAMHHSDRHIGKRPARLSQEVVDQEELMRLQEALSMAITDEDFEKAATLRDEIRKCKLRLQATSSAAASAASGEGDAS